MSEPYVLPSFLDEPEDVGSFIDGGMDTPFAESKGPYEGEDDSATCSSNEADLSVVSTDLSPIMGDKPLAVIEYAIDDDECGHSRQRAYQPRPLSEEERTDLITMWNYVVNERPKNREECKGGPRPCPYIGCKHNMYLDVTSTGRFRFNYPDKEPWEVPPDKSCALDLADAGERSLEEVGETLSLTRERIRQVEVDALASCQRSGIIDCDVHEDPDYCMRPRSVYK